MGSRGGAPGPPRVQGPQRSRVTKIGICIRSDCRVGHGVWTGR